MAKKTIKTNWNLDHVVGLKDWPKLYAEIEADYDEVKKWAGVAGK